MPVIIGIVFHSFGAFCAALCYTPQKKVTQWSWQTYWLLQAAFCNIYTKEFCCMIKIGAGNNEMITGFTNNAVNVKIAFGNLCYGRHFFGKPRIIYHE